jgi:hypothetical protein
VDHVVYFDYQSQELEMLEAGSKTMIIRGAAGRKMPYGRVAAGDVLYFVLNNGGGQVRACGKVRVVFNSGEMAPEESARLVQANQLKLQLTEAQRRRWSAKRYLILIEVEDVTRVEPFAIDRSGYGNMDDWLPVGSVKLVQR